MRVEVRARVQHHPSRAHLIPELIRNLSGLRPEVIEHSSDPPSPWAGYRLCGTSLPRCTHMVIVQDDVQLSDGFVPAVKQIARTHPDVPVCLFLGRLPSDVAKLSTRAMKYGQRYVRVSRRSFLPVVAMLWPKPKLLEFVEWADEHPFGTREIRSDDAYGGRWKMVTNQTVLACVPSIVEHPDVEPSTIGKQPQWGAHGRNAAHFARDAAHYDWTAP